MLADDASAGAPIDALKAVRSDVDANVDVLEPDRTTRPGDCSPCASSALWALLDR